MRIYSPKPHASASKSGNENYRPDAAAATTNPRDSSSSTRRSQTSPSVSTLAHELSHARHHDRGCDPNGSKAERRARRETALRLINPTEYAIAEQMYEGDSYLIAQALDVTVQVIEDYKELLHDSVAV